MWVWKKHLHKYVNLDKPNEMKLDSKKVRWIVRQKQKGELTNAQTAQSMNISSRWVQKLWARHRHENAKNISHPKKMGRAENGMYGRREHCSIVCMAARTAGIRIPPAYYQSRSEYISQMLQYITS